MTQPGSIERLSDVAVSQPQPASVSRRGLVRWVTGAGAAAGLTLLAVACGGKSEPTVTISDDLVFHPARLTISVGQKMTWQSKAKTMVHTATCDPTKVANAAHVVRPDGAEAWDSGLIVPGARWSHTFTVAGEYRYSCIPHELAGMFGTIIVR